MKNFIILLFYEREKSKQPAALIKRNIQLDKKKIRRMKWETGEGVKDKRKNGTTFSLWKCGSTNDVGNLIDGGIL